MSIKNEIIDSVRLTNSDRQNFFGYYDIPAFSQDMKHHLCHRAQIWRRLPNENDVAELGIIDIESREFHKLTETTAWNFQQGALLQWHPNSPNDTIIYNIHKDGAYRGVIMNIHNGEKRLLDMPIANVDPTGKYAISINFSRLYDFRPGYGYVGIEDPYKDQKHPAEDGVFLIDLETGNIKLILSLEEIWDKTKSTLDGEDMKILINHITFNTDGTRFVCLARYFPRNGRWGTSVLTANTDGSDIYLLSDYAVASHYHWRDTEHIAFYASCTDRSPQGLQLYLLKDKSLKAEAIDTDFFRGDGHCSYSPDKKWMLYDSYPDKEHYRHLYLYNLTENRGIVLGSYYHDPSVFSASTDIRCDLHPRWSPDGKSISFDSIHDGGRHLYYADLSEILQSF